MVALVTLAAFGFKLAGGSGRKLVRASNCMENDFQMLIYPCSPGLVHGKAVASNCKVSNIVRNLECAMRWKIGQREREILGQGNKEKLFVYF